MILKEYTRPLEVALSSAVILTRQMMVWEDKARYGRSQTGEEAK
jgi:hypothetical protein